MQKALVDWLARRQKSLGAVATTTTPNGQTLDWVPLEGHHKGEIPTPPPAAREKIKSDPKRPTASVEFVTGEPGPDGCVPILRPDLSGVKSLKEMKQQINKRDPLQENNSKKIKPLDISPNYYHALSVENAFAIGCEGWFNVWDPAIAAGNDHSISQTWLQSPDATDSLEAGLTVDRSLNPDGSNYLFTYFTTNLYSKEGKNIGGYNRIYEGWQQIHATIYPGIRINGTSQDGGGQLELGLKFQLFQGRWWFGVNNRTTTDWIWLGFYPASLFQHGLATQAVREIFGGEVFATAGNPCSTTDQMGSGRHAAAGWTHAAYQRNLRVLDINQNQQDFNGTALVDAPPTCSTSRYTIDTHMKSGSTWGSYQFVGGTAN